MVNCATIEVLTSNITRMATVAIASAFQIIYIILMFAVAIRVFVIRLRLLFFAKNKFEENQSCRSISCPVRAC